MSNILKLKFNSIIFTKNMFLFLFGFFSVVALLGISINKSLASEDINSNYISGYEAYAEQLESLGFDANAVRTYIQETKNVISKEGYVGEALPLGDLQNLGNGVYTLIGSMIWPTTTNFGFNNNLSFIVFEDGVFVFNAGTSHAIAYTLHQHIKAVTDKPVKWVAVENHQSHAILGASYWYDIGVRNFYAHKREVEFANKNFEQIKSRALSRAGHLVARSRNIFDNFQKLEDKKIIDVGGGEVVELLYFGPGHTPGGTILYAPSKAITITGDMGFNERLISLFTYTSTINWVPSFKKYHSYIKSQEKKLGKKITVIPGHGTVADMDTVKENTSGYLEFLQNNIKKIIKNNGELAEAQELDQSKYSHKPVYNETHKNNAEFVFYELKQN